jgi:quinol monooxygenase YgiN
VSEQEPRTIRLEDTTLVVEHVRAWRLEASYSTSGNPSGWHTVVWIRDVAWQFHINGDHVQALTTAVEGLRGRR